jgi:uncharacterized protein (DUF4415 family)
LGFNAEQAVENALKAVQSSSRLLTREEMLKGVEAYRKKRGRPIISATRKEQVSVRCSPEVLSYFRATGEDWQTRMDAALQLLVKKSRMVEEARLVWVWRVLQTTSLEANKHGHLHACLQIAY